MPVPDPEQLAARYGDLAAVVRRAGRVYPAACEPRPDLVARVVDAAGADDALRAAGRPHVVAACARLPWLYDGATLAFVAYDDGVLRVAPGRYFDRLGIGEAIRADAAVRERADALAAGDPLRSGAGRGAAPGVTTIATFPDGRGGRAFVLGMRRGLPVSDGDWHVVPAGTMEVVQAGADPIAVTARAEVREELGLEPPAAPPQVLGVGWDLERLLPEVVLRVDLDEPLEEVLHDAPLAEHDELRPVGLDPDALAGFWRAHPPQALSPPGAAAVALLEHSLA